MNKGFDIVNTMLQRGCMSRVFPAFTPEVIVYSVDYDGCISRNGPDGPLKIDDLMKNMANMLTTYPKAKIVVMVGSYRQDLNTDICNHSINNNGSCFVAIHELCSKFKENYPLLAHRIELIPFLLGDILHDLTPGKHFQDALTLYTQKEIHTLDSTPDFSWHDERKCALLFSQMQHIANIFPLCEKIWFKFHDDKENIIQHLAWFYTQNSCWMPSLVLSLHRLLLGKFDHSYETLLVGTGYTDKDYRENTKRINTSQNRLYQKTIHLLDNNSLNRIFSTTDKPMLILEELLKQLDPITAEQRIDSFDQPIKLTLYSYLLYFAIEQKNIEQIVKLLKKGAHQGVFNVNLERPIIVACKNKLWDIVKIFIQQTLCHLQQCDYVYILLHAAHAKQFDLVRELSSQLSPAIRLSHDEKNASVLNELVLSKEYDLLKQILDGADCHDYDIKKTCHLAFQHAINESDVVAAEILFPIINTMDYLDCILFNAFEKKNWIMIDWLMRTLHKQGEKLELIASIMLYYECIKADQIDLAKLFIELHVPVDTSLKLTLLKIFDKTVDIYKNKTRCSKQLLLELLEMTACYRTYISSMQKELAQFTNSVLSLRDETLSTEAMNTLQSILNSFLYRANTEKFINTDLLIDSVLLIILRCAIDSENMQIMPSLGAEALCKKYYTFYLAYQLMMFSNLITELNPGDEAIAFIKHQSFSAGTTLHAEEIKLYLNNPNQIEKQHPSEKNSLMQFANALINKHASAKRYDNALSQTAYRTLKLVIMQTDLTQESELAAAINHWSSTKPYELRSKTHAEILSDVDCAITKSSSTSCGVFATNETNHKKFIAVLPTLIQEMRMKCVVSQECAI